MAEKGFGVKEVNLIGASGTPTITSPNNLNLNANNVAISTNVSVGGTLTVSGNISIGGTLTYEDVTNIDSVGIITARAGINLTGGNITLGDSSSSSDDRIKFGASNDCHIHHNGTDTFISNDTGDLVLNNIGDNSDDIFIRSKDDITLQVQSSEDAIVCKGDGAVELYHNANKKFETSSSGATVTGTLTATTFSGSGASLTSIPAGQLTGTVADARISTLTASKLSGALPAISGANLTNLPADTPTNSDIQVVYTVTANGSSAYRFAGNGVVSSADNPDLYFLRGQKYRFINNSGGSHPFQIREASGGTAYSTGVTNNGAASGNIDFAPTYDSPAQLVYQCTSHGGMVGNIYLRDAAGNNTNVGVTTFSSVVNISGNTNISSELRANGNIRITNAGPKISLVDSNHDDDFEIKNNDGVFTVRDATNGIDRHRILSSGQQQFGRPGAFVSGTDENNFAFTFSNNAATTHPNTNNRDTDFIEALQITGPVRDTTNTPALVITEMGGQATGRQSLVFFNGDYNSGAGYIKSRIYTQVGSSYLSTNFYIDVADTNKAIQQRFRIDQSGTFYGSSNNSISDQRLKKDIATITDPLTKIKGLTGRTFKWKEDSTKFDGKTKYGFVAQEVETIVPELVDSDGLLHFDADDKLCDEFEAVSHSKSVVETGVIPITVEALKALIAKVETLEAEVAALKAK